MKKLFTLTIIIFSIILSSCNNEKTVKMDDDIHISNLDSIETSLTSNIPENMQDSNIISPSLVINFETTGIVTSLYFNFNAVNNNNLYRFYSNYQDNAFRSTYDNNGKYTNNTSINGFPLSTYYSDLKKINTLKIIEENITEAPDYFNITLINSNDSIEISEHSGNSKGYFIDSQGTHLLENAPAEIKPQRLYCITSLVKDYFPDNKSELSTDEQVEKYGGKYYIYIYIVD